jgi:hypothetical protein
VRFMLSTFMVFASMLAADPVRTTEPGAISDSRPVPKAAKSKRTFRPLRFLRRLGSAESEFALRLSSLGIQRGRRSRTSRGVAASKTCNRSLYSQASKRKRGFRIVEIRGDRKIAC